VRVLFKGGSYSFLDAKNAGLIQGRVSFKGGPLSRIYGKFIRFYWKVNLSIRGEGKKGPKYVNLICE